MSLKFYRASNLFYDPPSRLRQTWRAGKFVYIKGSGLVFVVDANYQYDKADDEQGNRETKADTTPPPAGQAGTTNYAYDDANQLTSESKPGGEVINYTYDENGNTTIKNSNTEGITTYSYDNKNQLVKVTKPNMDVIEFIYNAEGTRTEKKVNSVSTYYQYDANGNIVLETDSSKNIKARYIRDTSGKALALELPTPDSGLRTYYYLYNAHGDVTGLTDSSGNVVATYTYDEFGNQVAGTGYGVQGTEIYNPLRYSGANNAYYDTETGLYKMGTRYYNSSTGRWITKDEYEGEKQMPLSQNRYVYVEGNPVTYFDSTGNAKQKWPIEKIATKQVIWSWVVGQLIGIKMFAVGTYKLYKVSGTRANLSVTLSGAGLDRAKWHVNAWVYTRKKRFNFLNKSYKPGDCLYPVGAVHKMFTKFIPKKYGRPYKNVISVTPGIPKGDGELLLWPKYATMAEFKLRK